MNKIALSGILVAAAGLSASALAQAPQYTFQMQLVPDTTSGTNLYPIGNPADVTATRVAFWLQARVSSTGENWGIGRASPPTAPDTSFITITGGGSTLSRGSINAAGTSHGRGNGFRNGGVNIGNTGNTAGNGAFPSTLLNNNGGLDSGNTRIYSFDAYVGASRTTPQFNDPENGLVNVLDSVTGQNVNPWNVNGAAGPTGAAPTAPSFASVPVGEFSPWANLYRVWVDITDFNTTRDLVLNAHALLNAGQHTQDVGGGSWPMQMSAGQVLNASYTMHIVAVPTPGAAAILGLGGLLVGRRRR